MYAYSPLRRGFMIKKNLVIELELLRSHANACLNRGEHGEVKTSFYGGLQRIRISSQCSKRAVREAMHAALGDGRGYRTIQLSQLLAKRLTIAPEQSDFLSKLIVHALSGQKLEKENANTLLFISDPEMDAIAKLFTDTATRDALFRLYTAKLENHEAIERAKKAKKEAEKKAKAAAKAGEAVPVVEPAPVIAAFDDGAFDPIKGKILAALQSASLGWDIALHGRMTANAKASSVDSALSVAHSFTVHEAQPEADYFSALDDLQRDDQSGSAYLDEAEFGSGTFYSYAALDVVQLIDNLFDKPRELSDKPLTASQHEELSRVVEAWLRASVFALPKARRNTMNADTMPSYVRITVTKDGVPVNHAAAFEHFRTNGESVVKTAIKKLEDAVKREAKFFGIAPEKHWAIDLENDKGVPIKQALEELRVELAKALGEEAQ
jgi:CRISPR system Cascade subunit CasC